MYGKRQRSDSLGREDDNLDSANPFDEQNAYQPRQREDTFHLRRRTIDSPLADSGMGDGADNDNWQSPMGGANRNRRYSTSSDGDGGSLGGHHRSQADRLWSEATSGGGAEFVRRISSNNDVSPLKKSLIDDP